MINIKGFDSLEYYKKVWNYCNENNLTIAYKKTDIIHEVVDFNRKDVGAGSELLSYKKIDTFADYMSINKIAMISHKIDELVGFNEIIKDYDDKNKILIYSNVFNLTTCFGIYHIDMYGYNHSCLNQIFEKMPIKSALKTILNMSIKMINVDAGVLDFFESEFVKNKNELSKEEIDSFYFSFINKRQNQIKKDRIKSEVCNFILSKYSNEENILKKYDDIYPYFKSIRNINKTDVFFNTSLNIINLGIDIQKIQNLLLTNDSLLSYQWFSDNLCKKIGEHYNTEKITIERKTSSPCNVYFNFSNKDIKLEDIKNMFLYVLSEVKNNNLNILVVNQENNKIIDNIILKYELSKDIKNKTKSQIKL